MTNQDLYTTLDQSRIVAPIMQRLGIEPDAYWCIARPIMGIKVRLSSYAIVLRGAHEDLSKLKKKEKLAAYRLDKLLLALPELCAYDNGIYFNFAGNINKYCEKTDSLLQDVFLKRGSEAIKACVELILLLDKEGLL